MNHWKIVVWCIQLSHTFLRGLRGRWLTWSGGSLHKVSAPPVRHSHQWWEHFPSSRNGSWQPQGRFRVNPLAPDCCLPNRSQESKTCGATRQATLKVAAHRARHWHLTPDTEMTLESYLGPLWSWLRSCFSQSREHRTHLPMQRV